MPCPPNGRSSESQIIGSAPRSFKKPCSSACCAANFKSRTRDRNGADTVAQRPLGKDTWTVSCPGLWLGSAIATQWSGALLTPYRTIPWLKWSKIISIITHISSYYIYIIKYNYIYINNMLRLKQSVVILNDSGDSDDCVLDSFLERKECLTMTVQFLGI
jgi:hypothetical protein